MYNWSKWFEMFKACPTKKVVDTVARKLASAWVGAKKDPVEFTLASLAWRDVRPADEHEAFFKFCRALSYSEVFVKVVCELFTITERSSYHFARVAAIIRYIPNMREHTQIASRHGMYSLDDIAEAVSRARRRGVDEGYVYDLCEAVRICRGVRVPLRPKRKYIWQQRALPASTLRFRNVL